MMLGNLVNALAIVAGCIGGLALRGKIASRFEVHMMQALSLGVLLIGIQGALGVQKPLAMFVSLALGALIGEALCIETQLEKLSVHIKARVKGAEEGFVTGLVSATLLFCVGAMAIVGSLNSGLYGDHSILFAKSLIDGVISVLMASTLGIGVAFSAFFVFIYQGSIVLMAGVLSRLLTDVVIGEMAATGSLLIVAIGLNMMGVTKIKVGNLLPAVAVVALLANWM